MQLDELQIDQRRNFKQGMLAANDRRGTKLRDLDQRLETIASEQIVSVLQNRDLMTERDALVYEDYLLGTTQKVIADKYGIALSLVAPLIRDINSALLQYFILGNDVRLASLKASSEGSLSMRELNLNKFITVSDFLAGLFARNEISENLYDKLMMYYARLFGQAEGRNVSERIDLTQEEYKEFYNLIVENLNEANVDQYYDLINAIADKTKGRQQLNKTNIALVALAAYVKLQTFGFIAESEVNAES